MLEPVFITLVVIFVVYLLYQRKKRKEQQMGEELDDLIKANDWQGVSRILRKQLIIWGLLAVIATAIGIISFIQGKPRFGISLGAAFFIWRVIQLARLYRTSRDNERWLQEEAEGQQTIEEQIARIQAMLSGCNVTRVRDGITPEALMEKWKETRECGKREGFCPVLLLVDSNFVESMDDDTVEDRERFRQWQYQMLNAPVADGHTLLKERFESLKSDYETDCDWQTDIVGTAQTCEAVNDFSSFDGHFLLAEIPVNEPWQIFAYFPFGDWNDCPSAEEHMAVAKYWYEKYGAVVACMTTDTIAYHVPKPVNADDAMTLAEEQFAYSEDVLQDFGNLSTLAEMDKQSSIWSIWWD